VALTLRLLVFLSALVPPAALGWWLRRSGLRMNHPRLVAAIVAVATVAWAGAWVMLNMFAAGRIYERGSPTDPAHGPAAFAFSLLLLAVIGVIPGGIIVAYRSMSRP
jgi:hypothetical protein